MWKTSPLPGNVVNLFGGTKVAISRLYARELKNTNILNAKAVGKLCTSWCLEVEWLHKQFQLLKGCPGKLKFPANALDIMFVVSGPRLFSDLLICCAALPNVLFMQFFI